MSSPSGAASGPPRSSFDAVLSRVRELLSEGRPDEALTALSALRPSAQDAPFVANARAVCHMRAGLFQAAMEELQRLVVDDDSIAIRNGTPPEFLTNFATALLLSGNVEGCVYALSELAPGEASSAPLRAALERWEHGLTFWQRVCRSFGSPPAGPRLDFPPGVVP